MERGKIILSPLCLIMTDKGLEKACDLLMREFNAYSVRGRGYVKATLIPAGIQRLMLIKSEFGSTFLGKDTPVIGFYGKTKRIKSLEKSSTLLLSDMLCNLRKMTIEKKDAGIKETYELVSYERGWLVVYPVVVVCGGHK